MHARYLCDAVDLCVVCVCTDCKSFRHENVGECVGLRTRARRCSIVAEWASITAGSTALVVLVVDSNRHAIWWRFSNWSSGASASEKHYLSTVSGQAKVGYIY